MHGLRALAGEIEANFLDSSSINPEAKNLTLLNLHGYYDKREGGRTSGGLEKRFGKFVGLRQWYNAYKAYSFYLLPFPPRHPPLFK